jgi:hypothetical protein
MLDARPEPLKSQPLPVRRDADGGWLVQIAGEDAFSFDTPASLLRLSIGEEFGDASSSAPLVFQALLLDMRGRIDNGQHDAARIVTVAITRGDIESFLVDAVGEPQEEEN